MTDHPYSSAQGYLLGATTSITGVVTVTNLPSRHAPMLAKSVSTLSELSGGRVALGVGAGVYWDEVSELTVERTWHMAGMRASGSHTLVAEHVLVPAEHIASAAPFPVEDMLLYATTALGPAVGAARGALDAIDAMFASDRKPFMSAYSRMGESSGARQWLAEATHLVNRAERTMFAVARAADTSDVSAADAPRLKMELADAGRDCRAAVEGMLDLHGASGFNTSNVLQRYWRDLAVASRHPHLNPYLAVESFGTTLVERP